MLALGAALLAIAVADWTAHDLILDVVMFAGQDRHLDGAPWEQANPGPLAIVARRR